MCSLCGRAALALQPQAVGDVDSSHNEDAVIRFDLADGV
jgi:hypothetical protein